MLNKQYMPSWSRKDAGSHNARLRGMLVVAIRATMSKLHEI